jgi:hypothetical protein
MATTSNVTAIHKARPAAPKSFLTESPSETAHRVACVLKYLAARDRDHSLGAPDADEEFASFMILMDLANALEYAREVNYGR